jgi:hypothetical protein
MTLPDELRAAAAQIGRSVFLRIRDPEQLTDIEQPRPMVGVPALKWSALDTAFGDVGLAVAFGYMIRVEPDSGWDEAAHSYIARSAAVLETSPHVGLGLYRGISGLAFAMRYLSLRGQRYTRALGRVDSLLIDQSTATLDRLPDAGCTASDQYDLISGVVGVGAYLSTMTDAPSAVSLLHRLLGHLVAWSGRSAPDGFWTSAGLVPEPGRPPEDSPVRCLDLGVAHGISGVLALLAICARHGVDVRGMQGAADRLVTAIRHGLTETRWGPDVAYRSYESHPHHETSTPSRVAWCYGNLGVARSLQLAGLAFSKPTWEQLAHQLVRSAIRRPPDVTRVSAPTFCHGQAGVLHLLTRFQDDLPFHDPLLTEYTESCLRSVMGQYDPQKPFGFSDFHPLTGPVDNPGLLEGAAGVALVLASLAGGVSPDWERLFLIG